MQVPAEKRFGLIGIVLGLVNKDLTMTIKNLKALDFFPPDTNTEVCLCRMRNLCNIF